VTHKGAEQPVLAVENLSVGFPRMASSPTVVSGATLSIAPGEIHGLVGESGSGKTMIARAVLDLLPPGAEVTGGDVRFEGRSLKALRRSELRSLRGPRIGMIFQEPMMSLNPAIKIGRQMAECLQQHTDLSREEIYDRCVDMLERVRMPDPPALLTRYPHEFSGGMRQRIMLASVLMMRPALLLADEPTTALDVLIQQEVLEIMLEIVREIGTAVLLITHDLGLVAKYAHRATVLRQGAVVEQKSVASLLRSPSQDYTRGLLASLPGHPTEQEEGEDKQVLLEVRDLRVTFSRRSILPWRKPSELNAVDGVSFEIRSPETVAVVGESGSGKTTLGRAILKLVARREGRVLYRGRDIHELHGREERALRRELQVVFQDPYSSLDPRKRVGQIVGEGLRLIPDLTRKERRSRVAKTLEQVGIPRAWTDRYPHELSGGQRQRVGIARAIITRPRLIVADEAVSALDLTVQAQILGLFERLQNEMGFSYLFITHDLGVVEQLADRVLVMFRGQIVESGRRDDIFNRPQHPYTCALLNAVPELAGDTDTGYRLRERGHSPAPPPADLQPDRRHEGRMVELPLRMIQVGADHIVAFGSPPRGKAGVADAS